MIGTVSSALSIQKREVTLRDVSETSHPEEEREAPDRRVHAWGGCVGGTGLFRKRGTVPSTHREK